MSFDRWYDLSEFIEEIEDVGSLTDVLLPFLLIFTIVFAILQKSKILGEGKKNFNVVVSLVVSLLVVIPHVTGSYGRYDVIEIINEAIPQVSLIVVAIVMLLLILGIFGAEVKWAGSSISGWIAIISFIIIIWIFGAAADWWGDWDWFESVIGSETISIIIIILVFGIIIAFITGSEGGNKDKANILSRIGDEFKNFFGGGGK